MVETTTGKVYRNKWLEQPDYGIRIEPARKHVRVSFAGQVVAESEQALLFIEPNHGPVYYLPRAESNMALLSPTDNHTHCPWKGHASYYTISVGERVAENAVWSYEDPYPEIIGVKGYLAFYPDRVDEILVD